MKSKVLLILVLLAITLVGCSRNFSENDEVGSLSITSGNSTFDRVLVHWNDPAGLSVADRQFYDLFRSTSSGVALVSTNIVATGNVSANQLTDTTCSESTMYYYKLVCKDSLGNMTMVSNEISMGTIVSSAVTIVMATVNATPTDTMTIKTTWYYPYAGYQLFRATGNVADVTPDSSIFLTSGYISSDSSTINVMDTAGAVTPSMAVVSGNTYSYQAFLTLFDSNIINSSNNIVSSNVVRISY